jgi:hypothetical protein
MPPSADKKGCFSWPNIMDPTCSVACWSRFQRPQSVQQGHRHHVCIPCISTPHPSWICLSRLESGAIYCIGTIFLAIAVVFQGDIYHIGISVSQEMLVGLDTPPLNYANHLTRHAEHNSNFHAGVCWLAEQCRKWASRSFITQT